MAAQASAPDGPSKVPERPSDDERRDAENGPDAGSLPDHLDLPLETPEADALEQELSVPTDEEAEPR